MQFRVALLLIVAVLPAACGTDDPEGLEGFETSTITVGDRELVVAVAETPTQRSQGLMGVTDLGGLDGMLFVFQVDYTGGFWMKNTLIPLDIAFFAADGRLVDSMRMVPCTEDPCPVYRPGGAYRYALEAPAGDLAFVRRGTRLELDA